MWLSVNRWLFIIILAPLLLAKIGLAVDHPDLLAKADALYQEREDLAKANQAADLYRQAMEVDPDQARSAWKLTRVLCWIIDRSPEDHREALAKEALAAAKEAVRLAPDDARTHFWLGLAYVYYAETKGILQGLSLKKPILEAMETAIRLDPAFEGGAPYMVLGRLYFSIPMLLGGSKSKATDYLEKAIQLGPRRWINHIYLAECYIHEGREDEARQLLNQVLAGPPEDELTAEYQDWKRHAERLLKKLG